MHYSTSFSLYLYTTLFYTPFFHLCTPDLVAWHNRNIHIIIILQDRIQKTDIYILQAVMLLEYNFETFFILKEVDYYSVTSAKRLQVIWPFLHSMDSRTEYSLGPVCYKCINVQLQSFKAGEASTHLTFFLSFLCKAHWSKYRRYNVRKKLNTRDPIYSKKKKKWARWMT